MAHEEKPKVSMEDIISLCKRRGFIYQGSEVYGGLAGTWDYGPLGVMLKDSIKKLWWKRFVDDRLDMYGMDAAILMNSKVWVSSGHVGGFADPLVECLECKKRFRVDQIVDESEYRLYLPKLQDEVNPIKKQISQDLERDTSHEVAQIELNLERAKKYEGPYTQNYLNEHTLCPSCGKKKWNEPRQFNMMFKTNIGAIESDENVVYLRPETAQGMFVNFKNILDTFHPRLPFGMGQIGKAFRNEIAPRDFVFRVREFEQMEIEYFVNPKNWEASFEEFRKEVWNFILDIGLDKDKLHELEIAPEDRAHYSARTIDFEYDFPFGKKELYGLAYRTDFDLKAHTDGSKVDLSYFDEETKERFTPHCIEPSFGLDRTVLATLATAYSVDTLGGEERVFLKLSPAVAPYRVAVFPLLKNKPELIAKAKEVWNDLRSIAAKNGIPASKILYDETGSIGKRYRRQDEVGTPVCVTVDFDSLEKGTVTVRDRDTGGQKTIDMSEISSILS